jgi:hypothetical protein
VLAPPAEDKEVTGSGKVAEPEVSNRADRVADSVGELLNRGRIVEWLLIEVPALAHVSVLHAEGETTACEREVVDVEGEVMARR